MQSKRDIPHYYLTVDINMDNIIRWGIPYIVPLSLHTHTHTPPSGASPIDKLARLLRRESADKVTQRLLSHSLRHTRVTEMAFLKRVTVCFAACGVGTGGHTVTANRGTVHVHEG